MKARCHYPKHVGYIYYGARGIKVCPRWFFSYEAFLADMGRRPSPKHSIDRINNDGDYEPENCRWATAKEQSRDKDFKALNRKAQAAIAALQPEIRSEKSKRAYATRRRNAASA